MHQTRVCLPPGSMWSTEYWSLYISSRLLRGNPGGFVKEYNLLGWILLAPYLVTSRTWWLVLYAVVFARDSSMNGRLFSAMLKAAHLDTPCVINRLIYKCLRWAVSELTQWLVMWRGGSEGDDDLINLEVPEGRLSVYSRGDFIGKQTTVNFDIVRVHMWVTM